MVPEKNESANKVESTSIAAHGHGDTLAQTGHGLMQRRRLLMAALATLILAIAFIFGIPWIREIFTTVSTDDAYVNGHVTFVAARVPGQVSRVLVDDNNRVNKGDLLVELDREPYQVVVAVKKAAVDTAKADLEAAKANVRGIEARARSQHWKLQHAMEDVENQIALLHAKVATLDKSKATLKLAEAEFDRAKQLVAKAYTSREEFDRRDAALSVARAEVTQALEDIHQIRVSLGLPAEPENSADLGLVPPDLDQNFSSVRQAQSELIQSAAEIGIIHSINQTPKQMLEEFSKRDPHGDIDKIFAALVPGAPAVKQAEAKLESAKRDLDQAELNLRYCKIIAEIDGVVTRRNVNPGNNVLTGQGLMAIRSLDEIARRVLGRQQSQRRAGAHRKTGDPAREYAPAAIHVGIHVDRLTDTQILQLCLFEIGVDPNFAKRADRHQTLAGQDIIAGIDIAARDNAVNFGDDLTIPQV